VYVGERPATLTSGGALGDLAPTVLSIMGLQQPPEMTGKTLIHFADVSEKA
jgi:2,3-bisphosphoglycerate-independent phosphoglycerate mutase